MVNTWWWTLGLILCAVICMYHIEVNERAKVIEWIWLQSHLLSIFDTGWSVWGENQLVLLQSSVCFTVSQLTSIKAARHMWVLHLLIINTCQSTSVVLPFTSETALLPLCLAEFSFIPFQKLQTNLVGKNLEWEKGEVSAPISIDGV